MNGYKLVEGTTVVPLTRRPNKRKRSIVWARFKGNKHSLLRFESNRNTIGLAPAQLQRRFGHDWRLPMRVPMRSSKTRIRTLNHIYENFKMIPGEAIDYFFTRFADIVNPLMSLGKNIHPRRVGDESFVVFKRLLIGRIKRYAIEEGQGYWFDVI